MRWILAITLLIFSSSSQAQQKIRDFESWTGASIELDLPNGWTAAVEEQVRFDNHLTAWKSTFTDLSTSYKINKYLQASAEYRFAFIPEGNGHRLGVGMRFRYPIKPVTFYYTMKYQWTTIRHIPSFNRWRNKFQIRYKPFRFMSVYAFTEINYFFNFAFHGVNWIRTSVGLRFEPAKRHQIKIFYALEDQMNVEAPKRVHIFGLGYKATIKI